MLTFTFQLVKQMSTTIVLFNLVWFTNTYMKNILKNNRNE